LAVAAGVAENLARVEAAWNEEDAESKTSDEENDCHCDVARHAHLFVDGCHALCATELALKDERCGVFGLHDCKIVSFGKSITLRVLICCRHT